MPCGLQKAEKLEIEEANIMIRGQEIVIRSKSVARKLRGIVKTRLSMEELEELYCGDI